MAVNLLKKGTHPYAITKELLAVLGEKVSIQEITGLDRERHERAWNHGFKSGGFWTNEGDDHHYAEKTRNTQLEIQYENTENRESEHTTEITEKAHQN